MKGLSLLLVSKDMPGVNTRKMKCSGVWSSGTTYITFDDVKVPASHLIGKEGAGFKMIMNNFNHERFGICAMTNRFSRVCMEESLKLAEMARQIESTHAWLENITYQMQTMHKIEAT